MKIIGIIPARFASTRFPGKPLVKIGQKTMIQRVYEQVSKAQYLDNVLVATDDQRIYKHIQSFNGQVVMTATTHQSGTDRCAEAIQHLTDTYDIVINIQGDEPFIHPEQIDAVAQLLQSEAHLCIATLAKAITTEAQLFNPNVVKVVIGQQQQALYFSRHPIPYIRKVEKKQWLSTTTFYKHLGLYGYRTPTLQAIAALSPARLERLESLEQLRWLEHGYSIGVGITTLEAIGIDTPEDLNRIRQKLFSFF